jgi:hypothetical protein
MAQVFLLSSCLIGSATSVLVLIVWPKIRRVLSGEKVVLSKLLGASYGTSSLTTTTLEGGNQRRITQAKDDPLPRHLEADIVVMEALLRDISNAWYVVLTAEQL